MDSNGPPAGAASSNVRENSSTPAAEAASSTAEESARTAAGLASFAARRRHFLGPPGRSTYAQVAAGALGEYGAEDVDPADHLDALYEGEVAGSQWPRRSAEGEGGQGARERRWSERAAEDGLNGEGSSSAVGNVEGEREVPGGGSGRHREGESSSSSQSIPDQTGREGNIPAGPSGGITIHSIQPHLPSDRLQHPNPSFRPLAPSQRIEQPILDPAFDNPYLGADLEGSYQAYDRPPDDLTVDEAPWRSLYTHGNEPLDVDAGGIEGVYEDVMDNGFSAAAEEAAGGAEDGGWRRRGRGFRIPEDDDDGEEDIGLLMSARNAHDNAEERLRRGGNNMRRRNMIQELISRHSARPHLPLPPAGEVEAGTTRRVQRARVGVRPPTISSSVGTPIVRSTNPVILEGEAVGVGSGSGMGSGSKGRARSISADGPCAKRRKLSDNPTNKPDSPPEQVEVRPSYLSHFTLPPSTPLPTAFEPPARDSHLALTTYTPLTPLPPLGRHITQPQISFTSRPPNTSSSSTVRPWRPSSQPTTGRAGITGTSTTAALRDRDAQREREYGDSDATSLRTNLPIPPGLPVHYYEIKVLDSGPEGYMSLGWVTKGVNMQRLVGWEKGTWGFHADDGRAFEGRGTGRVYSSGWGVGDVIGAGVDFTTRRAFFTRNGVMIGPTFTNLPLKGLHPAIGLRNPRESLAVNLLGPFMFDIDAYVLAARDRILSSLKSRPVEIVPSLPLHPSPIGDGGRGRGPVIEETILSPPPGPIRVDSTGAILLQTRKPRSEPIPIPTSSSAEPSTESGAKAEEEGHSVIAPESELVDPSQRAQLGFVLDFLAHRGLDKVKGLVVKDLERRKAIVRPSLRAGQAGEELDGGRDGRVGGEKGESAAKRIEGICGAIKAGGRVPFDLIPLVSSAEGEEGMGMGGLGRKLRILDLVAMATPPSSSPRPAVPAGPSTITRFAMSADGKEAKAEVEADMDMENEAEVEMNEAAMKAGRELLALSKIEKWSEGEKGWLNEAFGVVCGLPLVSGEMIKGGQGDEEGLEAEGGVWEVRRKEWSEELRVYMREQNNLKPKSHLEHALLYSQALISTLADGMDGSAGFVDPKDFLEGYGRKEVKGQGKMKAE